MTGAELIALRNRAGLVQRQMAKLMGMAQPNYARIESGARALTLQQSKTAKLISLLLQHGLIQQALEISDAG